MTVEISVVDFNWNSSNLVKKWEEEEECAYFNVLEVSHPIKSLHCSPTRNVVETVLRSNANSFQKRLHCSGGTRRNANSWKKVAFLWSYKKRLHCSNEVTFFQSYHHSIHHSIRCIWNKMFPNCPIGHLKHPICHLKRLICLIH